MHSNYIVTVLVTAEPLIELWGNYIHLIYKQC